MAESAALTREEILGDMFYAGTLGYEPKVNYFFGLPTSIESGGITLDIPWSMVSHVSDGDKAKRKQYNLQWGMIGSALEHAVPEQMFQSQDPNDPKPKAISAVKALQIAGAEGQRIYLITQANMDTALPNIHHDGKGEIQAALQAGMTVITHTDSVSVPGWTGGGYIILDPEDNTGAYKISGGSNGGFLVALLITIIAFILLFFAFEVLLAGGALALLSLEGIFLSVILAIEINGFLSWLDDIYAAKTPDDFDKANAVQALTGILGVLGTISGGVAAIVYAFGEAIGFLLTQ